MWLDAPPQAAYRQALELLKLLQALDEDGRITSRGTRMAKLGLHPRLGFMLLKAEELNLLPEACELAGLLSERDLLPHERNVDVALRLEALYGAGGRMEADRGAVQRIKAQAKQWRQMVTNNSIERKGNWNWQGTSYAGLLIALAYPDRIAQRRADGRYLLANGRGAALPELQPLSRSAFLAAAELDDAGSESRIRLAAELDLDMLEQAAGEQFQVEESVEWDSGAQAVRARRRVRLGSIILKETPIQQPSPEQIAIALADGIASAGLGLLSMPKAARQLQARMQLMARHNSGWPDVSEAALLATVHDWLLPHLYGMKNKSDLQRLNMVQILEGLMSWGQRQELDEQVPTHMTVPSGSRIPIDYSDPDAPFIAVRLQELFGLQETPRLAGGRLPLTLHLLSPSQRPVQVTRDLRSFWNEAYFEVKKDLKGRYPKHYWPDDPYAAQPTNRVKPRT